MILQDLWWMDYLVPVLLLLIAPQLSLYAVIIDIRESRQHKNNSLRARYAKKYQARHTRNNHVK